MRRFDSSSLWNFALLPPLADVVELPQRRGLVAPGHLVDEIDEVERPKEHQRPVELPRAPGPERAPELPDPFPHLELDVLLRPEREAHARDLPVRRAARRSTRRASSVGFRASTRTGVVVVTLRRLRRPHSLPRHRSPPPLPRFPGTARGPLRPPRSPRAWSRTSQSPGKRLGPEQVGLVDPRDVPARGRRASTSVPFGERDLERRLPARDQLLKRPPSPSELGVGPVGRRRERRPRERAPAASRRTPRGPGPSACSS